MPTIYGIKTCDTVKKARDWLTQHGVAYTFHDFREAGLSREKVLEWLGAAPWTTLMNRSSTTFRALPEADKADLDEAKAIDLMLVHPTLVKRPVLETGQAVLVGFKPAQYAAAFGA